jgi:ATP-dependent DNA helicase Rep
MNFSNLINDLNKEQLESVTYSDGPLLVIAGAGSGKTKVITNKIAYLIKQKHLEPNKITAITFTNKAAKEMQSRTAKLLNQQNSKVNISTFHSLGLKILKKEHRAIDYKENFSLLDSYDSGKIINDILKTTDKALIKIIQNKISHWKNNLVLPNNVENFLKDKSDIEFANIYSQYQETLKSYQAIDFDDLILLPYFIFKTNPEILFKWQNKIQYLLVDEYQDTNNCQYQLIKLIINRHKMLTAVGDDDQSIYTWRGASIENIEQLQQDFQSLKVIKLEQNYRSTTTILNAANHIIQNNPKLFEKKLWSNLGQGEIIKIISCKDEENEADTIIKKIIIHKIKYNSKFSDYAILYRSNHQARIIEQILRNNNMPYTISGGQSFFEKSEIKDILAYLRLLINDDDDTAFIRAINTPKRGIGFATIEKLINYSKQRKISLFTGIFEEGFLNICPKKQLDILQQFGSFINNLQYNLKIYNVIDILNSIVIGIKYEEYLYEEENIKTAQKKWENIKNLIQWLSKKSEKDNKTLLELLHTITLINILENSHDEEIDTIKLSTLHAAKGLEYNYVYIIGCEEGIIPHQESLTNNNIEEERRLIYVGITRAKKELNLSYCEKRRNGGELKLTEASRFINEMGIDNIFDTKLHKNQKITPDNLQNKLKQLQTLLKT